MLYDPSKRWPHGAWHKTGWGAEQVTGDPGFKNGQGKPYLEIVALDEKADVWEISPVVRLGRFKGYSAIQLGTVECFTSHSEITFEEVAVYGGAFFALDRDEGHAVWYYEPNGQCWDEIGSKRGFTNIATFPGHDGGVWAVDAKGNLWSVF